MFIFAAIAEAVTGLALLIVPSLVGQLLLGEELTGVAIPIARGWHRSDCLRDLLLAGAAAHRHVDLQRNRYAVSCLPRFFRWLDWRPSMAGGCFARDPINPNGTVFGSWVTNGQRSW